MFDRVEALIGKESLNKLKTKHIVVLGLGGVGGTVVESLIRSGIENITVIDNDYIDITNLNRQIISNRNNIGKLKTDVMEERIKSINDKVNVIKIDSFIEENNINVIFNKKIDYFIDACDSINTKKQVIKNCIEKNIKYITCLGTGKRLDPSKLVICDIRKTKYDPIAKILRKYVKDQRINQKVMCCYSEEIPISSTSKSIPSMMFVPSSAGLLISSYVIRDLTK